MSSSKLRANIRLSQQYQGDDEGDYYDEDDFEQFEQSESVRASTNALSPKNGQGNSNISNSNRNSNNSSVLAELLQSSHELLNQQNHGTSSQFRTSLTKSDEKKEDLRSSKQFQNSSVNLSSSMKSLPKSVKSPKADEDEDSGDLESYIMQMKLGPSIANKDDGKLNESANQLRASKSLEKSSNLEMSRASINKKDEAPIEPKKDVLADKEEEEDDVEDTEDHQNEIKSPKEIPLSVRSSHSGSYVILV